MQHREGSILIGITGAWLHADEDRTRYDGRPLWFAEESMTDWLMDHGGGIPVIIPGTGPDGCEEVDAEEYAGRIDGLVIQGGVDIAPESYGDENPEWPGDEFRDQFEIELVRACLRRDRPILGICRGNQLLNVALGGTLYQDIETQIEGTLRHRDAEVYHRFTHRVVFEPGSQLREMYGAQGGVINSVHHQAVRTLGDGLEVEARSVEDGIIESVRLAGSPYAVGVQWHPEFQTPEQSELLSTEPLLDDFIGAIRRRRDG